MERPPSTLLVSARTGSPELIVNALLRNFDTWSSTAFKKWNEAYEEPKNDDEVIAQAMYDEDVFFQLVEKWLHAESTDINEWDAAMTKIKGDTKYNVQDIVKYHKWNDDREPDAKHFMLWVVWSTLLDAAANGQTDPIVTQYLWTEQEIDAIHQMEKRLKIERMKLLVACLPTSRHAKRPQVLIHELVQDLFLSRVKLHRQNLKNYQPDFSPQTKAINSIVSLKRRSYDKSEGLSTLASLVTVASHARLVETGREIRVVGVPKLDYDMAEHLSLERTRHASSYSDTARQLAHVYKSAGDDKDERCVNHVKIKHKTSESEEYITVPAFGSDPLYKAYLRLIIKPYVDYAIKQIGDNKSKKVECRVIPILPSHLANRDKLEQDVYNEMVADGVTVTHYRHQPQNGQLDMSTLWDPPSDPNILPIIQFYELSPVQTLEYYPKYQEYSLHGQCDTKKPRVEVYVKYPETAALHKEVRSGRITRVPCGEHHRNVDTPYDVRTKTTARCFCAYCHTRNRGIQHPGSGYFKPHEPLLEGTWYRTRTALQAKILDRTDIFNWHYNYGGGGSKGDKYDSYDSGISEFIRDIMSKGIVLAGVHKSELEKQEKTHDSKLQAAITHEKEQGESKAEAEYERGRWGEYHFLKEHLNQTTKEQVYLMATGVGLSQLRHLYKQSVELRERSMQKLKEDCILIVPGLGMDGARIGPFTSAESRKVLNKLRYIMTRKKRQRESSVQFQRRKDSMLIVLSSRPSKHRQQVVDSLLEYAVDHGIKITTLPGKSFKDLAKSGIKPSILTGLSVLGIHSITRILADKLMLGISYGKIDLP